MQLWKEREGGKGEQASLDYGVFSGRSSLEKTAYGIWEFGNWWS